MIKINGKVIRNIPEQVGKNKRDIFQLDTDLTALEVKVNEALSGVFRYKGSVATYGDLPASDNEVGDVYNVIDTGKNYAWDGSAWDDLGGLVDLSNYVTLDSDQTITSYKYFSNAGGISAVKYNGAEYGSLDLFGEEGVYITTGSSYRFVDVQGDLDPNADNTYDLGSSHTWKDLHLAGTAYVGTISNSSGSITLSANGYVNIAAANGLRPLYGNYDLGSSSNAWKDLYLTGKINYGTENYISWNGSQILIKNSYNSILVNPGGTVFGDTVQSKKVAPQTDNVHNLGDSTHRYVEGFFSTGINDGTNSATIADIAALITYAKAQGWIS